MENQEEEIQIQPEIPEWLEIFLQQQQQESRERRAQEEMREERHRQEMLAMQEMLRQQNISTSNDGPPNSQRDRSEKSPTIPRPPTLEVKTYTAFLEWRETWNDYCSLSRISTLSSENQRAHLRSCIDTEMKHLLRCAVGVRAR